jgi:hypothetical protein
MNTNLKHFGIAFWLFWVLASAIGFGLGAVLGIIIPAVARIPGGAVSPILFGAIFGAIGGFAQWMVIRRQIAEAGLWIPLSALAFMLAVVTTAGSTLSISPGRNPLFILAAIYGLLGGFLQSLILEKRGILMGWWIAASVVGGLLGCTMNGPAIAATSTNEAWQIGTMQFFSIWFRLGAPIGFGLGITTGAALFWFSRNPRIESKHEAVVQGMR